MAKKKFKLAVGRPEFVVAVREKINAVGEDGEPLHTNLEIAESFGHTGGKNAVMWLRQTIDNIRKKFVARFTERKDREPTEEEVDAFLPRLNDERGANGGRPRGDDSWMDDDIDDLLAAGISDIDPDLVDGFVKL